MAPRTTILLVVLVIPVLPAGAGNRFTSCLPEGVTLKSEVVDYLSLVQLSPDSENPKRASKRKPRTVQSTLLELKAQCKNGVLTDRHHKEIRIVRLIGCWGNPPEDYQEQLDRQTREIEELGQKYIVIQVPCSVNKTIARLPAAL